MRGGATDFMVLVCFSKTKKGSKTFTPFFCFLLLFFSVPVLFFSVPVLFFFCLVCGSRRGVFLREGGGGVS